MEFPIQTFTFGTNLGILLEIHGFDFGNMWRKFYMWIYTASRSSVEREPHSRSLSPGRALASKDASSIPGLSTY